MVRMSEVAFQSRGFFELLVSMEFCAIIERDRFEVFPMLTYGFYASLVDLFNGPSLDLLDDKEASLPFYQRNDAMVTVATDYRIAFPVPDACSVFNLLRSFLDHAFALQTAPGIMGIVAFSPSFGYDAKVFVESASFLLVIK